VVALVAVALLAIGGGVFAWMKTSDAPESPPGSSAPDTAAGLTSDPVEAADVCGAYASCICPFADEVDLKISSSVAENPYRRRCDRIPRLRVRADADQNCALGLHDVYYEYQAPDGMVRKFVDGGFGVPVSLPAACPKTEEEYDTILEPFVKRAVRHAATPSPADQPEVEAEKAAQEPSPGGQEPPAPAPEPVAEPEAEVQPVAEPQEVPEAPVQEPPLSPSPLSELPKPPDATQESPKAQEVEPEVEVDEEEVDAEGEDEEELPAPEPEPKHLVQISKSWLSCTPKGEVRVKGKSPSLFKAEVAATAGSAVELQWPVGVNPATYCADVAGSKGDFDDL
jgi:hypothetical protein